MPGYRNHTSNSLSRHGATACHYSCSKCYDYS